MTSSSDIPRAALIYCRKHGIQVEKSLGYGIQGSVYATSRNSAIKIHERQQPYLLERNAYLRLAKHDIRQVCGLTTPKLRRHDDENLTLEMDLVSPPFLVDFGGAYLDALPDHAASAAANAHWEDKREMFGDDWGRVEQVLAELRSRYGIYVLDVNPGNVRFR